MGQVFIKSMPIYMNYSVRTIRLFVFIWSYWNLAESRIQLKTILIVCVYGGKWWGLKVVELSVDPFQQIQINRVCCLYTPLFVEYQGV